MIKAIRSPFFYVGDKYKLMPQLQRLFPTNINNYYEPFCGGGSSFLNTKANHYIVNDIDSYVIKLHQLFNTYKYDELSFIEQLFDIIKFYGLSCSNNGINVPTELKQKYVKTYYAKYNKESYIKMRNDFNANQTDMNILYLLLIYGFNHMIRFNSKGLFNLPVGNVDYNKNVANAISAYFYFLQNSSIKFENFDYKYFLEHKNIDKNDFIFCDPPYLISQSEYNKIWSIDDEYQLYDILDNLNNKGIKFGITNLICHKGKVNTIFSKWAKKYNCYYIDSNYISFNDNTIKKNSQEVYVTNG